MSNDFDPFKGSLQEQLDRRDRAEHIREKKAMIEQRFAPAVGKPIPPKTHEALKGKVADEFAYFAKGWFKSNDPDEFERCWDAWQEAQSENA